MAPPRNGWRRKFGGVDRVEISTPDGRRCFANQLVVRRRASGFEQVVSGRSAPAPLGQQPVVWPRRQLPTTGRSDSCSATPVPKSLSYTSAPLLGHACPARREVDSWLPCPIGTSGAAARAAHQPGAARQRAQWKKARRRKHLRHNQPRLRPARQATVQPLAWWR